MYGEDGSFSIAYSVEDLESAPTDWVTYTFDGNLITLYSDEMGYCRGKIVIFEVAFPAEGEVLYTATVYSTPAYGILGSICGPGRCAVTKLTWLSGQSCRST